MMNISGIEIQLECECWHCKGRGYRWPMDDEPDESKRIVCEVCRGNEVIPTGLGKQILRLVSHNPDGIDGVWPISKVLASPASRAKPGAGPGQRGDPG